MVKAEAGLSLPEGNPLLERKFKDVFFGWGSEGDKSNVPFEIAEAIEKHPVFERFELDEVEFGLTGENFPGLSLTGKDVLGVLEDTRINSEKNSVWDVPVYDGEGNERRGVKGRRYVWKHEMRVGEVGLNAVERIALWDAMRMLTGDPMGTIKGKMEHLQKENGDYLKQLMARGVEYRGRRVGGSSVFDFGEREDDYTTQLSERSWGDVLRKKPERAGLATLNAVMIVGLWGCAVGADVESGVEKTLTPTPMTETVGEESEDSGSEPFLSAGESGMTVDPVEGESGGGEQKPTETPEYVKVAENEVEVSEESGEIVVSLYPNDTEGFELGAGGSEEGLREMIWKRTSYDREDGRKGSSLEDMEFNLIRWLSANERAEGEAWVSGDDWEEVLRDFEEKFAFEYGVTSKSWHVVVREKSTGRLFYAVDENGFSHLSLMPLGAGSVDAFDLVPLNAEGKQQLVPVTSGESAGHVVIGIFDGEGNLTSWSSAQEGGVVEVVAEGMKRMKEGIERVREELETGSWELQEPRQHEDGTWLLYRKHPVTNREQLVSVWNEESKEWVDYIKRITSPDGKIAWDVHASWYEYKGKPGDITEWRWNPEVPDAAQRWEEASDRALWSLAAYTTDKQGNKLNPGISLQEIQDGVKFQFLNNEGEIVTVDTNKQVRYVWGVSNFHGKSEYSMGVESFYLLPNDKNELEIHLVLPLTTLLRANKEYDIRLESGLADIYYFMMLKSLCVPEYIAGIDNNVEGYYDYYVFHDNPNQSNYDEIEKLLWGRVFRGKKPEGSPIDYSKSDEDPELVVVDWQGE